MKIEVDKKYFIGIVAVMLIIAGAFFVVSYNVAGSGGVPSDFGHSADELEGLGVLSGAFVWQDPTPTLTVPLSTANCNFCDDQCNAEVRVDENAPQCVHYLQRIRKSSWDSNGCTSSRCLNEISGDSWTMCGSYSECYCCKYQILSANKIGEVLMTPTA